LTWGIGREQSEAVHPKSDEAKGCSTGVMGRNFISSGRGLSGCEERAL